MSEKNQRPQPRFFATAAKGTEPLLRDELNELGLPRVRADRGGVHLGAEQRDAYRACLWSRIAQRVLDAEHTLAVRAACRSSRLSHTQYIAQRTKDAVVDQLREQLGARPNVD